MKNLLYIIAALLFVIWGIIFFGISSNANVHLILALAGIIVIVRLLFSRQLSKK